MQQTGSKLELDLNSSDLDVICVNDDAKHGGTGGGARRSSQAGREESSSGAESSDSEDGDTVRDEAMGPLRKNVRGRFLFERFLSPPAGRWTLLSLASCLVLGVRELNECVLLLLREFFFSDKIINDNIALAFARIS